MQAVQKYDTFRGVKLSTYAAWWIRAYILRYLMDNWRMVKLGTTQAQRKLFFNLRKEQERLLSQGFEAAPALLAEKLDVSEQDVREMDQRLGNDEFSLDAPASSASDENRQTQGDRLVHSDAPIDEKLADEELRKIFKEKLTAFGATLTDPAQDAVDTLEGGLGNDTFVFVRGGDIVTDAGGIDTIVTDVSWTLGAAFENLSLIGDAATSGIGNTLANLITGSDGNNFLQAGAGADTVIGGAGNDTVGGNEANDRVEGGLGNDTVTGGSGQDSFVFRELGTANADFLTDFASAWDGLQLDLTAFTAIGTSGKFAAGDARFFAGAGATGGHDANDRVVYNTTTGALYYDADGSGAGAAQLVATLQTHPAIAATDITVI